MVQYIVAPEGVEPSLTEPKPVVLPLYYRAVIDVEPRGVEPRSQDFQSCAYTKSAKAPCLVAPDGFEPSPPDSESDVLTVTPWSNSCDEGGTRTHDRLLRRQLL